ncbi:hypothetical protein [Spirosoma sordidisoli]|uniref:Uncharacterized protein n=1 Tax=Spirosoma sordidisoli TaxID=2502893 RepID=A0A4Q2USK5_9BACT|nr:hypothetical protein [Spirosoma sordidisoli]RYC70700.1 hypothetical protein EQG79_00680 [Spirosoma sordidisoli]
MAEIIIPIAISHVVVAPDSFRRNAFEKWERGFCFSPEIDDTMRLPLYITLTFPDQGTVDRAIEALQLLRERMLVGCEEADEELMARTDRNMNLISAFAEHLKKEAGIDIPDSAIESFFDA